MYNIQTFLDASDNFERVSSNSYIITNKNLDLYNIKKKTGEDLP